MDESFVEAEPRASAMIESLRAVGYDLPTAVADLVDNSLAAHARTVWIRFSWLGSKSYVIIRDDGDGMSPEQLTEAMRPGTIGPLETRRPDDLGRFGLGLKTASLSQCQRLTVASRSRSTETAIRRWDLDYVRQTDKWRLLTTAFPGSETRLTDGVEQNSGTVVLWECLDRLVGDVRRENTKAENRFYEAVRDVEEYLAMVFHRFLRGPNPRLRVFVGAGDDPAAIEPWDPFLERHEATVPTPEESIHLGDDVVRVKGFVLPHKSKLSVAEHQRAGGPGGWNARQGFYVHRNDRLVVAGSWLGLGQDRPWTREEHYKLARICVDIPNTMDLAWQLDVKKSSARPPAELRGRMKELATNVRSIAKNVFSHRGSIVTTKAKQSESGLWKPGQSAGHPRYRVDRKHPLVERVKTALDADRRSDLEALLILLEETVPVHRIWIDMSEQPDSPAAPFELTSDDETVGVMRSMFAAFTEGRGLTADQAIARIRAMGLFGGLVNQLDAEKGTAT